jgi:hypothetical protein
LAHKKFSFFNRRGFFPGSLGEVKKQHKAALDQAMRDLKDARARESQQLQILTKLQKQHSKQGEAQKKLEDEAKAKALLLERTAKENKRLKADLDALAKSARLPPAQSTWSLHSNSGSNSVLGGAQNSSAVPSSPVKPSLPHRLSATLLSVCFIFKIKYLTHSCVYYSKKIAAFPQSSRARIPVVVVVGKTQSAWCV